jgi:hypothetical protein
MAEAKPAKRQRVQRLDEWDGARYSIIPADAWIDPQLSLGHLRILAAIGRVNTQLGWCEFSQTAFAKLVGANRVTVSEAVNDLVRWRYVEMKGQKRTRSAVCQYRIMIDDPIVEAEAEHLERGFEVGDVSPTDDTSAEGAGDDHVSSGDDTPPEGDVSPQDDTGVASGRHGCRPQTTPPIDRARAREILDQRSLPPKSPTGGPSAKLGDEQWKIGALAALRERGRHRDAVDGLIAPLLESDKRLGVGKGAAAIEALADLAHAAHGIPKPALDAAVARLLADPQRLTPTKIRAAIDTARKGGALVVVRRGTPQWSRWLEHFERTDPKQARLMRIDDSWWQVPAEWPPASGERASGTTGRAA